MTNTVKQAFEDWKPNTLYTSECVEVHQLLPTEDVLDVLREVAITQRAVLESPLHGTNLPRDITTQLDQILTIVMLMSNIPIHLKVPDEYRPK